MEASQAWVTALAVAIIACGSTSTGGGTGGSAGASTGGTGTGGSSTGGTGGSGGTGTGGTGGTGTGGASTGGTGAGGTGGSGGTGTGGTGGTGTGGASTGGTGGNTSCGNLGHACTAQLCVKIVHTAGPTETVSWQCAADPCAPSPLACNCASSICAGSVGGFCQVGAPGDNFDLMCQSGGICASPDTPIATPEGERAIASLHVGDLVYSIDHGELRAVPLVRVRRTPVIGHHVMRVALATGAVLEVSPLHPTADGHTFGDLRAGASLDGVAIMSASLVPYAHHATYDILPASDTATYFAGGVLIGSTLATRPVLMTGVTAPCSGAR